MSANELRPDPSPSHKEVTKAVGNHEVSVGFYPGFASSITVNGESLYNQAKDGPDPFVLPSGSVRPMSASALEISSSRGYRVVVHLDDPDHCIDRIDLVLRDPKLNGGGVTANSAEGGDGDSDVDTVTVVNTPVLCPPFC